MNTKKENHSHRNMKNWKAIALVILAGLPMTLVLTAGHSPKRQRQSQVERGKYLVAYGGCNDCHTPLKMTEKGPRPDVDRMLSGHPQEVQLPPPGIKPGPWFAATAGMTAWAGPWGISFAANLTPDTNTGLGIWTEEIFLKAMKTGKHMGDGRDLLPPMPWQALAGLTEEDLKAVYAFLRTIPAVPNRVPTPIPPGGETSFE
jgi:mono/diheme cytochrome c family protein